MMGQDGASRCGSVHLSLLLCALAYKEPYKSNSQLMAELRERMVRGTQKRLKEAGTGIHNKKLFKTAAKVGGVGEIWVVLKSQNQLAKLKLTTSKSDLVMCVRCCNTNTYHPTYSLILYEPQQTVLLRG